MAITKAQSQITWSAADSISVAAGGAQDSDAQSISGNATAGSLSVEANNSGTPASGDTVDVYLLQTNGDTTGAAGADAYDTANHGEYLGQLDTNSDNPAQRTFDIPVSASSFKLRLVSNAASAITCYARYNEQTAA